MFKRVFIEKEEIVVFICSLYYQKSTGYLMIVCQGFTKYEC
jgi:hypothetical protein